MVEDACMAYSRCGLINALYKGRKVSGIRVKKDRFRYKKHSTDFFGSTNNVIVGTKSTIQEKSQITDGADRLNGLFVG